MIILNLVKTGLKVEIIHIHYEQQTRTSCTVHENHPCYQLLPRENLDIHNAKLHASCEREMYAEKITLMIRSQCRCHLVLCSLHDSKVLVYTKLV